MKTRASHQLMSDSVCFLGFLVVIVSFNMLGCSGQDDGFREIEVSDNSSEEPESEIELQSSDIGAAETTGAQQGEDVDSESVAVDATVTPSQGMEPTEASNDQASDADDSLSEVQADAGSGQAPTGDDAAVESEPMPTPNVNSEESLASLDSNASPTLDSENPDADPEAESAEETDPSENAKPNRPRSLEEEMAAMRAKLLGLSDDAAGGEPREIKLLIPNKEFSRDEKTGALRITFDDIDLLKVLNMEPVPVDADKHLPNWLTELDGQRIVLRGWMFPTVKSEGIKRFLFVRDNGICCFGRMAKLYDKLGVTLKEGETTRYIEGRPFDVVGTFVLDPWILDDELDLLYHIEDAEVLEH
ncbi:prolipoprotein diacylglyceryl transferase [Thalassoglobus neptunius]|nr:hypothetical protein [Thalassoglobus neptunius]